MPKASGLTLPAARAILAHAIDYAGLFPPASLGIAEVIANYCAYQASEESWALGRLVIPAGRLAELGSRNVPIPVSALVNSPSEAEAVTRFNLEQRPTQVLSVEVRAATPAEAIALLPLLPARMPAYIELGLDPERDEGLALLSHHSALAKVRTGGTTAAAIPSPHALAGFLVAAARRRLGFKATAGLHHPLRSEYRLTYEPQAPRATMFGYLNLLLGSLSAWFGRPEGVVVSALSETDPESLRLEEDALAWRDERYSSSQVHSMRGAFFHGFGSCSFREPLDEWPLELAP